MNTSFTLESAEKLPSPQTVLEWLRESPTGKACRTARPLASQVPVSLVADMDNGGLHTTLYSHGTALVFEGTPEFIRRWHNWAVNAAVIGSEAPLNWYLRGHTGSVAYVCPPTRRHILRGLAYQFRWEIMRDRELEPLGERVTDEELGIVETVWDERAINSRAVAKARAFQARYIRNRPGALARTNEPAESIYEVSPMSRAERGWEEAA